MSSRTATEALPGLGRLAVELYCTAFENPRAGFGPEPSKAPEGTVVDIMMLRQHCDLAAKRRGLPPVLGRFPGPLDSVDNFSHE
jgi:hypothetical protein